MDPLSAVGNLIQIAIAVKNKQSQLVSLREEGEAFCSVMDVVHQLLVGVHKSLSQQGISVGAHGPGPPSSPTAGAGLPSTDVMDPAIPTSACGGEAYPNKDKAAAISRSMAHGGEAYPNKDKAAAIWRSRVHGREAYPNKDKAAAMLRSREPSLTSVEVV